MNPTAQDFIDLLPIVSDRGWRIKDGAVRDRKGRCPLCALAHEISRGGIDLSLMAWTAAMQLGVYDERAVTTVANAADVNPHPLRPALLAALGIEA